MNKKNYIRFTRFGEIVLFVIIEGELWFCCVSLGYEAQLFVCLYVFLYFFYWEAWLKNQRKNTKHKHTFLSENITVTKLLPIKEICKYNEIHIATTLVLELGQVPENNI